EAAPDDRDGTMGPQVREVGVACGRGDVTRADGRTRVTDRTGYFDQQPQVDRTHDQRLALLGPGEEPDCSGASPLEPGPRRSLLQFRDGREFPAVCRDLDLSAVELAPAVDPGEYLQRVDQPGLRQCHGQVIAIFGDGLRMVKRGIIAVESERRLEE